MKKAFAFLRHEPVMVAAVVSAALGFAATHGAHLSASQVDLVWSAVAVVFGFGVRQLVSPVA